jgi:hypothetical protein
VAHELQVGRYAAAAQVLAALVALVGVLVTDGKGSGQPTGASPGASVSSAGQSGQPSPSTGVPACSAVIDWYRMSVRMDPSMLSFLTTPGPDGRTPVETDPDARRCGLSKDALLALN